MNVLAQKLKYSKVELVNGVTLMWIFKGQLQKFLNFCILILIPFCWSGNGGRV